MLNALSQSPITAQQFFEWDEKLQKDEIVEKNQFGFLEREKRQSTLNTKPISRQAQRLNQDHERLGKLAYLLEK